MNKKIVSGFFSLVMIGFLTVPFNSKAGWDYKSTVSFDKMDGRWYMRSDCTSFIGDDCNVPGSSHRVDVDTLLCAVNAVNAMKIF